MVNLQQNLEYSFLLINLSCKFTQTTCKHNLLSNIINFLNNLSILEILNRTSSSLLTKTNSDIMYGPVLKSYIENVVHQINHSGMVLIRKAEDEIHVDEGYQAFSAAVSRFH